jgi:multiple antibiotic resistance protein
MLDELMKAFVAIFVIMDPFASLPPFIALTKGMTPEARVSAANTAALVAGCTLVFFTLFGPALLDFMGITMSSFQIAGGIMLMLIAIQFVLGVSFSKEEQNREVNAAIVLIGVPLLCGPGVMTTAILLSSSLGLQTVIIASIAATFVTWIILNMASPIYRIIGVHGSEIMSRLMGLLLGAIAIEFIKKGLGM